MFVRETLLDVMSNELRSYHGHSIDREIERSINPFPIHCLFVC